MLCDTVQNSSKVSSALQVVHLCRLAAQVQGDNGAHAQAAAGVAFDTALHSARIGSGACLNLRSENNRLAARRLAAADTGLHGWGPGLGRSPAARFVGQQLQQAGAKVDQIDSRLLGGETRISPWLMVCPLSVAAVWVCAGPGCHGPALQCFQNPGVVVGGLAAERARLLYFIV